MGTTPVRRRHSAFAAGLATLAMAVGLSSVPASASPPPHASDKTKYIALGDSFAAGQGAGPYLDECFRSENAYAELADEAKAINLVVNAACSGKATWDVVNTQLLELNKSTDLVTITAGGNNLGFGPIIGYCGVVLQNLPPAPECGPAVAYAFARLSVQSGSQPLHEDVLAMIRSVRAAAPNAKIVVTGYPYLVDPIPAGQSGAAAEFIYLATDLADGLNAAILAAANEAATDFASDEDIQYVDVRYAFLGHGALSGTNAWINLGGAPDGFHPNAAGYEAYFDALSQAGAYSNS